MESLAFVAAVLVATTFLGGPISILLARITRNTRKFVAVSFTLVFALPAFSIGLYLATLNIGIGGRLMGLFGVITSSIGIIKVIFR